MYSEKNLITPENVAIVLGPILLKEPPKEEDQKIQKMEDAEKVKKEKIYQRLTPTMKTIYTKIFGVMIEDYGVVFGLREDVNANNKGVSVAVDDEGTKAGDDAIKNVMNLMKGGSRLSMAIAKSRQSVVMKNEDEEQPIVSARTRRVGTVFSKNAPAISGAKPSAHLGVAEGNSTPVPSPVPIQAEDQEAQKQALKLADEWKKKYLDEAHARQTDKEAHLKAHKEWDEMKQLDERQTKNLKDELELMQRKVRALEDKYKDEIAKYKQENEALKKQRQEIVDEHEKQMHELRREYALLMKKVNSGADVSSYSPSPKVEAPPVVALEGSHPSSPSADKKSGAINVSSRFRRNNDEPAQQQQQAAPEKPVDEFVVDPNKQCFMCKKQISGQWFEANHKKYHAACFICSNCNSKWSKLPHVNFF